MPLEGVSWCIVRNLMGAIAWPIFKITEAITVCASPCIELDIMPPYCEPPLEIEAVQPRRLSKKHRIGDINNKIRDKDLLTLMYTVENENKKMKKPARLGVQSTKEVISGTIVHRPEQHNSPIKTWQYIGIIFLVLLITWIFIKSNDHSHNESTEKKSFKAKLFGNHTSM